MAQFAYRAVDRKGAAVSGTIEAMDRKAAVSVLAGRGEFVTSVEAAQAKASGSREMVAGEKMPAAARMGSVRVRGRDIVAMTHQFGTALRAGLPMMGCLELIRDQQKRPGMVALLDDLVDTVSGGQSLSDAMGRHPHVFSPLYISMIRVGETGGILEQTTQQLGHILRREENIKTSLKTPRPIQFLCFFWVLCRWPLLPSVMQTLDVDPSALPGPTRVLMHLSDGARLAVTTLQGWVAMVAIGMGLWYGWRWLHHEGRVAWDSFRLKIPIFGTVLRTISVGRFTRTLGALTEGGVTILEALKVVRDTLGNEVLGQAVDFVADEVRKGASLATPLDETAIFPPLLIQIVAVGEQTGKLDELLLNAADTFDEEADAAITRFMSIFPAILILLLAVIIGFIIIATLLPMVTMQLGGIG
ncbi:type II secretion system F family protein [Planctomycetota bacterium]